MKYLKDLIDKETKLSEELYITRRQIDRETERLLENLYQDIQKHIKESKATVSDAKPEEKTMTTPQGDTRCRGTARPA